MHFGDFSADGKTKTKAPDFLRGRFAAMKTVENLLKFVAVQVLVGSVAMAEGTTPAPAGGHEKHEATMAPADANAPAKTEEKAPAATDKKAKHKKGEKK